MLLWTSGGVVDFSTPEIDAYLKRVEDTKLTPEQIRAQYEQQWTPEMIAASAPPKKPLDPALEEKLARFSQRMKG